MEHLASIGLQTGTLPCVATAIHHGHTLRKELKELSALNGAERLREEDPFTGGWTAITEKRIVVHQSRFEFDLNRAREKAVYQRPEDAWGLQLWKQPLSSEMVDASLAKYDAFYERIYREFSTLQQQYGRLIVFDLHNYNHRREGRNGPEADPALNPEVNLGTASMNREYWAPIVDSFIDELHSYDFLGRQLDVRENIKFKGGHFPRWIHERFPGTICCLAIEFKKFFMDEWTGKGERNQIAEIAKALQTTIPGCLDALRRF